jgi:hypothetical protein
MQRCLYACKYANRVIQGSGFLVRGPIYPAQSYARVPLLADEKLWPCRRRDPRIYSSVPAQTVSTQSVLEAVQGTLGPLSQAPVVGSKPTPYSINLKPVMALDVLVLFRRNSLSIRYFCQIITWAAARGVHTAFLLGSLVYSRLTI